MEPFAKFGVGHEMGAECSCKITPSTGICTWLAMGFPGTTTLPDNKSRFLANFAKGSFIFSTLIGDWRHLRGLRLQTALGGLGFMDYTLANPLQIEVISRRSRSRAPEAT